MKVPHTICLNTLIAYKKPKERRQSSRIIQADDLTEWHKDIPKKLTIICIEVISQNWIGMLKKKKQTNNNQLIN